MDAIMNITLGITIAGILNTIYLSYHSIKGTLVYCLFFPKEWCEKVQKSRYSKTFGMPNPYLGFLMLLSILVLLLLYDESIVPLWYAMALINFGFLFSLYFLYIQAFIIKAYCTWCVVSALVFISLFILQFFL
ncbi:vitamin K epoxide reductase family protein [Christiangramia salexigens]|uniref:Vitamin K epoxide reductase domain-containing protein n=1 Tax=Christiangramia salexigens TaxID=1913577 RepID=A0A1L3J411_9FLAO|nr:vitamin K epoxide reductase family protein [Christiangramia salexigens]APG59879.1 hypothetical protein LPB144_05375 [Christiangramia salexigens]